MNETTGEKKSIGEMLRHPLANVVVGFLLTGVLGTTITQYYLALRERQKAQYELALSRKDSIATLATLYAEYQAHAERLLNAMKQGDKAAAKERKLKFDDAILRWQIEKPPTLLAIRDVLPEEIYTQFRDHLELKFRDQFLLPFGNCMESAVGELAAGNAAAGTLDDCGASALLLQAKACSRVLLDMLHELSGYTLAGRAEAAIQANNDKYRSALDQACSSPE